MTTLPRSEMLTIRGHTMWRDDFGWWRMAAGDAVRVHDPLMIVLLEEVRLCRLIDRAP